MAGLPDFLTESTKPVGLPPLLAAKRHQAKALPDATVSDYLIAWHTDWVRRLASTASGPTPSSTWSPPSGAKLKEAGTTALKEWKAANPTKKLDDLPFYRWARCGISGSPRISGTRTASIPRSTSTISVNSPCPRPPVHGGAEPTLCRLRQPHQPRS